MVGWKISSFSEGFHIFIHGLFWIARLIYDDVESLAFFGLCLQKDPQRFQDSKMTSPINQADFVCLDISHGSEFIIQKSWMM